MRETIAKQPTDPRVYERMIGTCDPRRVGPKFEVVGMLEDPNLRRVRGKKSTGEMVNHHPGDSYGSRIRWAAYKWKGQLNLGTEIYVADHLRYRSLWYSAICAEVRPCERPGGRSSQG